MSDRGLRRLAVTGLAVTVAGIAGALASAGGGSPVGAAATSGLTRFADHGKGDPADRWGAVDCVTPQRVSSPGDGVRRISVLDGDDFNGERCELGRNDRTEGPTVVYHEEDRLLTRLSIRLADDFPLEDERWQLLLQMKQTQPASNGGGTPVIELDAYEGRWRLRQSASDGPSSDARELWSVPAMTGRWTRVVFDVVYSASPDRGSLRLALDANGDGSFTTEERSPVFRTYTLKRETAGSEDDGLADGDSIPSHLRIGIYHDRGIECPADGCIADFRDVRVTASPGGIADGD